MYFVFAGNNDEADNNWGCTLETESMKEVRSHMNDRTFYPNPQDWKFKVIKGRELDIQFKTIVSAK